MHDEMVSFLHFVLCDNVTCDLFYSSRTLDHHSCATYASRIRTSLRAVNRDKRSSFSNTSSVVAAKSSPATPCTLLECLAKREAKRRAKRSARRSAKRSAKRSEKRSANSPKCIRTFQQGYFLAGPSPAASHTFAADPGLAAGPTFAARLTLFACHEAHSLQQHHVDVHA